MALLREVLGLLPSAPGGRRSLSAHFGASMAWWVLSHLTPTTTWVALCWAAALGCPGWCSRAARLSRGGGSDSPLSNRGAGSPVSLIQSGVQVHFLDVTSSTSGKAEASPPLAAVGRGPGRRHPFSKAGRSQSGGGRARAPGGLSF